MVCLEQQLEKSKGSKWQTPANMQTIPSYHLSLYGRKKAEKPGGWRAQLTVYVEHTIITPLQHKVLRGQSDGDRAWRCRIDGGGIILQGRGNPHDAPNQLRAIQVTTLASTIQPEAVLCHHVSIHSCKVEKQNWVSPILEMVKLRTR